MNEELVARFRRLEPLLDRALELDESERPRFVALMADIYPDLIDDLRRALAVDEATLPQLGDLARAVTSSPATDRRSLQAGEWRLLEKLGRGGMGSVYLAERDNGEPRRAAVKLLRGADERFREPLERERTLLARLQHPGIARLLDHGILNAQPYIVMELAPGEDLDDWLSARQPSLRRRLDVLRQVCDAVAHAHAQGVLHRDLKPSNVRVDAGDRVKLLDFGIGKSLIAGGASHVSLRLALTPDYAAPEQLEGRGTDAYTDIYALGALLYFTLTGQGAHPRFAGDLIAHGEAVRNLLPTPPSRLVELPPTAAALLDAIVLQSLAREPSQRPASAAALAQVLAECLKSLPAEP